MIFLFWSRIVLIRRERLIQRHMERLRANPRQHEVDRDVLRWTPATALNLVLSEEEREAEMDVGSLLCQDKYLFLPRVLLRYSGTSPAFWPRLKWCKCCCCSWTSTFWWPWNYRGGFHRSEHQWLVKHKLVCNHMCTEFTQETVFNVCIMLRVGVRTSCNIIVCLEQRSSQLTDSSRKVNNKWENQNSNETLFANAEWKSQHFFIIMQGDILTLWWFQCLSSSESHSNVNYKTDFCCHCGVAF